MAVISGTVGRLYSHGTAVTAFTNEECSVLSGDSYQIDDTAKRWWRPESPITVYTADASSTVAVDSGDYTRRDLGGVVEFDSTPAGSVQVSGTAYNMLQVGGFREWEITVDRDMPESTRQGSGGWRTYEPGMATYAVSANGFWIDDYFIGTVDPSVKWIVVNYVDYDNSKRYEAQTYLTSNNVSTEPSGLVEESVEFRCVGQPQYYES